MAQTCAADIQPDAGPRLWFALPWLIFAAVAALIFLLGAYPSLYGDEYWSLTEARHLGMNLGGIGYFIQLRALLQFTDNDWLLRSLSLFWSAIGMWALHRWLKLEGIDFQTRLTVLLLWATNPFLWMYAQNVRFYSFFVTATVLLLWRFRDFQFSPSRTNLLWLVGAVVLACTAQFFTVLVLAALVFSWLWPRLGRWKPLLVLSALVAVLLLFVPAVREPIVLLEERLQNQPLTPGSTYRGFNMSAVLKACDALFTLEMGQRVNPLWWWLSLPAAAILTGALVRGVVRLRSLPGLRVLVLALLLEVGFVFLVVEPLAPPVPLGAAPRHVIFFLPALLLALGVGTAGKWWLRAAVLTTQCIGLGCLLFPLWSADPADRMDWRSFLRQSIENPQQTYIVVDGRAEQPVRRYLPGNVLVGQSQDGLAACDSRISRILFISNDHRLEMTRSLDDLAASLDPAYGLQNNISRFPAQITVYDRECAGQSVRLCPSRLGLPEQDLQLPLRAASPNQSLFGFVRLDSSRPEITLPAKLHPGSFVVASNYRTQTPVPDGAPVARIVFEEEGGRMEFVLHANEETADWAATAAHCSALASWTKQVHLVGRQYYPGAYKKFEAKVWGADSPPLRSSSVRVLVQSLLKEGTFYFWGVLPGRPPAS